MGQGLWLAQEGHPSLPQPLYHSFQGSVTAVCGIRMQDEYHTTAPKPSSLLPEQHLVKSHRRPSDSAGVKPRVMCHSKLEQGQAVSRRETDD